MRVARGEVWLAGLLAAEVILALTLGGGEGLWSDAFVQLCSLPLLGLALSKLWIEPLIPEAKRILPLICGIAFLPLLQLVPLPPPLWISLPGRTPFAAAYQAAGMALPWEPLSLAPGATWLSFLSLLPGIAVFLAVLCLDPKARRILSLVILGFAYGSVLLGLAQLSGGSESLNLYNDSSDAVGLFANRNHYAVFLVCAIPIAVAWSIGLIGARHSLRGIGITFLVLAYVVLLLGLGTARSRAGLILALVAGFASAGLAWDSNASGVGGVRHLRFPFVFMSANLCGLLLAFQFGFVGMANRLENESVLKDLRWPIAAVTVRAIKANLPMGVGFGAFEPVYQMFEPPTAVIPEYVNHAHNDWLELILDGGLAALALIFAFLAWYADATIRIWRKASRVGNTTDCALARAGSIIVGILLLHSTVDYPLRITSLMVVFAFGAALMIPPAEPQFVGDARLLQSEHGLRPLA